MSYSRTTRTVKTITSSGGGPPRVETKTYTYGGDGGSSSSTSFGGDMDFGGSGLGFSSRFGGGGIKIRYGGGGGGDGGRSTSYSSSYRPGVVGRTSRREARNPFAGVVNQSYEQIKQKCQEESCLFQDPEFEADDSNIFFSTRPPRNFEWKRPSEICDDPKFVTEGASRFDVQQGALGDCWLLAAVASLTCNKSLLEKVVPQEQDFENNYCGVFKFNFWHQGDWIEVVVDDRLPTCNGQLVFMHSTEKNEFWSALLEKAYAKLNGSYESLKGGSTTEAMEDFTGGCTEMIDLRKAQENLLKIMMKANERGALMGCSIDADPNQIEAELANGLVMGHAYSVTGVNLVEINTPRIQGRIPLVRVRNPWGNEAEWKGAWSDQSAEWRYIPDDEKQSIGLTFDDDGEFWMSFEDFKKNFEKLEICNLGPDAIEDDEGNISSKGRKRWAATAEHGEWVRNVNAGGCRNYLETFATNPQYRVKLTDVDEGDDEDKCTMLVACLQKDRRKKRKEGLDLLTIGYVIYKLKEDGSCSGPLDQRFFKYNASCAKAPSFINMREVCGRHKLPPGEYVIIPSTFEPHQEGQFLLRIFTEKAAEAGEMDEATAIVDDQKGPPVTEEDQAQERALKDSFRRIAGDDLEIDAFELKDILDTVFTKEFKFDGFSIDVTRSMVAMHDGDLSSKLGFDEFKMLWSDLRKWKAVFKEYDRDNSGHLSSYELRSAFHASGFRLSNRALASIVMRFSNRNGEVDFGDFVLCSIRLKTMIESFKTMDVTKSGRATYDLDTFIQTTMYS